jgi:macrolide transport system ATP-binding/permease protein
LIPIHERSWGLPAWTEERRERSDWSDEGRPGVKAP